MEYTVLARRFRPQSFGEVIGQETIAQALRNAIAADRVAHAYLFTGARGVGKTSTARILAKSLNCPNASGGDPCNQCETCRNITAGGDVDVIEIDGASNRGIDEIRALRANVNVRPMRSRYKIYIIDEVHMLTKEAFNALLKTLEEPPASVKFIFCTTDPQRLPDTILSRCQRFDFGTIATATIGQRLAEIAAAEGVSVEAAAIQLVARRAAGSMRDSQSLFDQLLAYGGKTIAAADVHRLLGTAPDDRLIELARALIARERAQAIKLFDQALLSGVQLTELTDQLLAYFRDLMVLATGAEEALLISVSDDQRGKLKAQTRDAGLQTILAALQILAETKSRLSFKGVTFGRVLVELALIRIACLDQLDALADLIGQLKPGQSAAGGPAAPSVARSTAPAANSGVRGQGSGAGGRESETRGGDQQCDAAVSSSPPETTPVESVRAAFPDPRLPTPSPSAPTSSYISAAPPEGGTPTPFQSVESLKRIPFEAGRESEIWTQVISLLSDMAKSHAKNVSRTAISGPNKLVLTIPKSYHLSKQHFERSAEQLGKVEKALEQVVGSPIRVELTVDESAVPARDQSPGPSCGRGQSNKPIEAERDPLVQRALTVFGGTIVRVDSGTPPPGN